MPSGLPDAMILLIWKHLGTISVLGAFGSYFGAEKERGGKDSSINDESGIEERKTRVSEGHQPEDRLKRRGMAEGDRK